MKATPATLPTTETMTRSFTGNASEGAAAFDPAPVPRSGGSLPVGSEAMTTSSSELVLVIVGTEDESSVVKIEDVCESADSVVSLWTSVVVTRVGCDSVDFEVKDVGAARRDTSKEDVVGDEKLRDSSVEFEGGEVVGR